MPPPPRAPQAGDYCLLRALTVNNALLGASDAAAFDPPFHGGVFEYYLLLSGTPCRPLSGRPLGPTTCTIPRRAPESPR